MKHNRTNVKKSYYIAITLIFALSIILRTSLAIVNEQSNDDHIQVMQYIIENHITPHLGSQCWECYQQKLYHWSCLLVFKAFNISDARAMIHAAQAVNLVAGIATLFVAYILIRRIAKHDKTRILAFALVALNPNLIGINSQATNDTFAILFGCLATYFFYRFIQSSHYRHICLAGLFVGLGIISKNTCIPLFIIMSFFLFMLMLKHACEGTIRRPVTSLAIFVVIVFAIALPFGEFIPQYQETGNPFVTNMVPSPLPGIIHETYYDRPGVTSVVNSYLTFRFIGLIQDPMITNGWAPIPEHRTSLWTQLYGRLNFAQFDSWPPSWRTDNGLILHLGRFIFELALIPAIVFLVGLYVVLRSAINEAKNWHLGNNCFFLASAIMYVAFIVLYTAKYRDFGCMKMIFIFPALLAFIQIFVAGLDATITALSKHMKIKTALYMLLATLAACYAIDIAFLIATIVRNMA